MDQLVGTQEIADLLGVVRTQVNKWMERHPDFPRPVATLNAGGGGKRAGGTYVWFLPDVEKWARATGRWPVKPED